MNEGTTQMRGEWSLRANVSAHTLLYTYAHPVTFSGPSLRPTIESAPEIRFYVFRRAGRTLLLAERRDFCHRFQGGGAVRKANPSIGAALAAPYGDEV